MFVNVQVLESSIVLSRGPASSSISSSNQQRSLALCFANTVPFTLDMASRACCLMASSYSNILQCTKHLCKHHQNSCLHSDALLLCESYAPRLASAGVCCVWAADGHVNLLVISQSLAHFLHLLSAGISCWGWSTGM